MIYHITAFAIGFLLDFLFGDPEGFPHPIRLIGLLISKLEKRLYPGEKKKRNGMVLAVLTLLITVSLTAGILLAAYHLHVIAGILVEAVMTGQILAANSLKKESMKVYGYLAAGSLSDAKQAVSMIVGRDTTGLTEEGVIRAAAETIAENTSDGVIAPMLYLAVGGPVLGFFYKAVNTMDSMIGYKNERYMEFGRAAARLDDAVNFLPARISAALMIFAAELSGGDYNASGAKRIWKRDRKNHASPNSAQTESVLAGALSIRLGGPASYFGKMVEKPWIGDEIRKISPEDIKKANHLMYKTAWLCFLFIIFILLLLTFL